MIRIRHLVAALGLAALAPAQGGFVNFEVPQVRPIEVARINGHDYLLVCNTPNNTVEIFDTSTNAHVTSFKTGQAPVTVRYAASRGEVFTANFVGDSVTVARLIPGQWGAQLRAEVRRTTWVGDEPSDIVFFPDERGVLVSMNQLSAVSWWDADTMRPLGGSLGVRMNLTDPWFSPNATKALKEPRRMHWDGQLLTVLGFKGGNSLAFDYDLWTFDLRYFVQSDLGGLGTTNHAMARARDGRLFVVGTMARNDLVGEAAVAGAPTGFVESHLYVVDGAGRPGATVRDRDLNRDGQGNIVGKGAAVSQPTDVVLYESGGGIDKVFITGFHSDRLVVLHPGGGDPSGWWRSTIDLPVDYTRGYVRTGPRGLAWKEANWGQSGDPGNRLYCLNRLSNSVSVIDPDGEREVQRLDLGHDPTPTDLRLGRRSLYSAELSGTGFVACASCHVDGRTDSLAWDLGVPGGFATQPIDPFLLDGVTGLHATDLFPDDKGPMVTQTLQGLATTPVEGDAQRFFSGAPFHWRGDRDSLHAFNSAYVTLMGSPNVGTPQDPRGLSASSMQTFVDMMETIMFPPNREQWIERNYLGDLGSPNGNDGNGQLRGLKLFHTEGMGGPVMGGRSCVQCHSLPSGSNHRITSIERIDEQPTVTAELRMLLARESVLETSPYSLSTIRTGGFGLFHFGRVPSINHFVHAAFGDHFRGDPTQLLDLISFLRAFDSGIAPLVGASFTVDRTTSQVEANGIVDLLEGQARLANVGIAVHTRLGGVREGFYFDLSDGSSVYKLSGKWGSRTRGQLLSALQGPDDVLIFEATPIGSERRVSSLTGSSGWIPGPAPNNVELAPMGSSSAWEPVPLLDKNWNRGSGGHDFVWDGEVVSGVPAEEPRSLKTLRIFQHALINKAPQFGLNAPRHEAPRRFAVLGNDIRPGAVLELRSAVQPAETFRMPLFATDRVENGRRRWETVVEAEPMLVYMLLLGGPQAPDVQNALRGRVSEPPPSWAFDPVGWNRYTVTVRNEDGTSRTITDSLRLR